MLMRDVEELRGALRLHIESSMRGINARYRFVRDDLNHALVTSFAQDNYLIKTREVTSVIKDPVKCANAWLAVYEVSGMQRDYDSASAAISRVTDRERKRELLFSLARIQCQKREIKGALDTLLMVPMQEMAAHAYIAYTLANAGYYADALLEAEYCFSIVSDRTREIIVHHLIRDVAYPKAEEQACKIEDPKIRSKAFLAIFCATHHIDDIQEAIEAAGRIEDPLDRSQAWFAIACIMRSRVCFENSISAASRISQPIARAAMQARVLTKLNTIRANGRE